MAAPHMRKGRIPFIITFLAPTLVLYSIFVLSPFAQGIQLSLTNWTGLSDSYDYVGLQNFSQLLQSDEWWNALFNNLKLLLFVPILTLGLALLFASLLTRGGTGGARQGLPGTAFYRVLFFFPQVVPVVIVAILFQFLYSPEGGLLTKMLELVGIDMLEIIPNGVLGNQSWILWGIGFAAVWAAVGFYMVLFIAGMQQIPRELYESAALDGASRFRMFFSVTLPLLWGHVQVSLVYIGITVLDMFALVSVMAHDGTSADFGADVMSAQLYRTAFGNNPLAGYAAAMGTMLLVLSLIFAVLTFTATRRERLEY